MLKNMSEFTNVIGVEELDGMDIEFYEINKNVSFAPIENLQLTNDFELADEILDMSDYTYGISSENVFNRRKYTDLLGTYKILIDSRNSYIEFENLVNNKKRELIKDYEDKISEVANLFYQSRRDKNEELMEKYRSQHTELGKKRKEDKNLSFEASFEEWKNNKLNNGSKLTKELSKRFNGSLLEFYNTQNRNVEKEVYYFTISDRVHHIAGMSYFSNGKWQGMNGSSCQDTKNNNEHVVQLLGALHDDKLFVGFLHKDLEDLEDMEGKAISRTLFRLISHDNSSIEEIGRFGKNMLVATYYYHNSSGAIENALLELQNTKIGITSNNVIDYHGVRVIESANGSCSHTMHDEVQIYETIEDWIEVDCPLCSGSGKHEVLTRFDIEVEIDCPLCNGSGKHEAYISVDIDEYIEVEIERDLTPYDEKYSHYGNYISISLNKEMLEKLIV